jgi:hypothetical protein
MMAKYIFSINKVRQPIMKKITIKYICILFCINSFAQNTITKDYLTSPIIPANHGSYDGSCNGPSAVITVIMPPGETYAVDSTVITYNFSAVAPGLKSHQRSKLGVQDFEGSYFEEDTDAVGIGNSDGTQTYTRTTYLANGPKAGGEPIEFQLWALSTNTSGIFASPLTNPCSDVENYISRWTVVVHYRNESISPKIGVNVSSPKQTLDINGKIKIADDTNNPAQGSIRWNETLKDFEAYSIDGKWISMTNKSNGSEWGNNLVTNADQCFDTPTSTNSNAYGFSLALGDDYAIAAPFDSTLLTDPLGKIYYYKKTNTGWAGPTAFPDVVPPIFNGQGRSSSIEIDKNIVVVSSAAFGIIRNYHIDPNGVTDQGFFNGDDTTVDDGFGLSIDLNQTQLIAGSSLKNSSKGKAYIFDRIGNNWIQKDTLVLPSLMINEQFGKNVAISNNYAAVTNDGYFQIPKLFLFKKIANSWVLDTTIILGSLGQKLTKVYMTDDYVLVGMPFMNKGVVSYFTRSGSTWERQSDIVSGSFNGNDQFGLDLDGNNDVIAVTSKNGTVYVFNKVNDRWQETAELKPDTLMDSITPYNKVGLSNNTVFMSNTGSTNFGNFGKVYFFNK